MNKKLLDRYLKTNYVELEKDFSKINKKKKYPNFLEFKETLLKNLDLFNKNRSNKIITRNSYQAIVSGASREEENLINKIIIETVIGDDTFYYIQREIIASDYKKDRLVRYQISNEDIMQIKLGLESCLSLEEKIQFCLKKEEEYRNKALKFETSFQLNGGENEEKKYADYLEKLANKYKKQLDLEGKNILKDNGSMRFIDDQVAKDILEVLKIFAKKTHQHDYLQDLIYTGTNEYENPIYIECCLIRFISCFEPLIRFNLIPEYTGLKRKDRIEKLASWISQNFTTNYEGIKNIRKETVADYLRKELSKHRNDKLLSIEEYTDNGYNSFKVISDHLP